MYTKKTAAEVKALKKPELEEAFLKLQDELAKPADEKLASALAELAEANSKNATLEQTVQDLNTELANSEKKPATQSDRVVKIGGNDYRMLAPSAEYKGIKITLEALQADEEIAKELVSIGAGFLELVK